MPTTERMHHKKEIYNWLIMALSEPLNSFEESFYYDRRDGEFYSIHFADFLLLNEDLTLNEKAGSSYPKHIEKLIADRVSRCESKDVDILEIAGLEIVRRKAIMKEFISKMSDPYLVAILQQRMENQDGSQRFDFYFGSEATDKIKEEWIDLKYKSLIPLIDQFIEDNKINLEMSRVWDIGDSNGFSVNVKLV